ncbi:MAG: hemerythrin domain-containing protein [Candidatus Odinarchaeota archaeon]
MNPTDVLKEEHAAIQQMLTIMERICSLIDEAKPVDPDDLEQVVDFIQTFADKCHHGKEEDLLFPAAEAAGIPRTGGPVGVMLREHVSGREFVRNMKEAVTACKAGDGEAAKLFSEHTRKYIALLRSHIAKEDNILYPMIDQRLTAGKQQELLEAFDRVEQEVVGAGKHEAYHALLKRLASEYVTS